eukprot:5671413-Prymnesium_polylepis.1
MDDRCLCRSRFAMGEPCDVARGIQHSLLRQPACKQEATIAVRPERNGAEAGRHKAPPFPPCRRKYAAP